MLCLFARAMNPCLVGLGPVLFAQPNVRGVARSELSWRKTFAVILDASKYRGHPLPKQRTSRSSGGHPACSST